MCGRLMIPGEALVVAPGSSHTLPVSDEDSKGLSRAGTSLVQALLRRMGPVPFSPVILV